MKHYSELPGYLNNPCPQCWHFPEIFTDYKSHTQFNPWSISNYLHLGGTGTTGTTGIGIGVVLLVVFELVLLVTVGVGVGVGVIGWGTQVRLATTYIKLTGQQPPSFTILLGSLHEQSLSETRAKLGKQWVHL